MAGIQRVHRHETRSDIQPPHTGPKTGPRTLLSVSKSTKNCTIADLRSEHHESRCLRTSSKIPHIRYKTTHHRDSSRSTNSSKEPANRKLNGSLREATSEREGNEDQIAKVYNRCSAVPFAEWGENERTDSQCEEEDGDLQGADGTVCNTQVVHD